MVIANDKQQYYLGLLLSLIGHALLFLFIVAELRSGLSPFEKPVVYSISLEPGKTLGGRSQVPKENQKQAVAPPKNVAKKETKAPEVKAKKPEVVIPEKTKPEPQKKEIVKPKPKPEPKVEKPKAAQKKPVEKKPAAVKKPPEKSINQRLEDAVQRYLGESSDAGGRGFGAGAVGGAGMGGGVVRPPEFFQYKNLLENHIKSGWRWYDTNAALVAKVQFAISRSGEITGITLLSTSGNREYDESVLRAIGKANPAPPPPQIVYQFFEQVRMTFDPRE